MCAFTKKREKIEGERVDDSARKRVKQWSEWWNGWIMKFATVRRA